jgi:hypothetical protein
MILGDGMRRGKKENLRLTAKQRDGTHPQLAYPADAKTRMMIHLRCQENLEKQLGSTMSGDCLLLDNLCTLST